MKKIVYVTGTRAEYGLMRSTLVKINSSPEFKVILIVTGMHLNKKYGNTIEEIKKDNFIIAGTVEMLIDNDSTASMAKSLGTCIIGVTPLLEQQKPDLLLLQGDRGESLAAAIVAAHMNVPICHVGGGDVSGSIDDKIRNAITMFSDIHCPATEFCANRILSNQSIQKKNVHIVGEPGLDDILSKKIQNKKRLFHKLNIPVDKPLLLIIQHPDTNQSEQAGKQMIETIEASILIDATKLIIYPNSDAGSIELITAIQKYENTNDIITLKNLNRDDFIDIMKYCSVLIGNSSAGIIEAPSLQIPVINIGTRQKGRVQASNVINVEHDRNQIKDAINQALNDDAFIQKLKTIKNPYGDGMSSIKIYQVLKRYFEVEQ